MSHYVHVRCPDCGALHDERSKRCQACAFVAKKNIVTCCDCGKRIESRATRCRPCADRVRVMPRSTATVEERFWAKIVKDASPEGCWLWTGATNRWGYGNFTLDARRGSYKYVKAHRFAYELLVGPIADGLQLDHLCGTTLCVKPAHLRAVTPLEHQRRHIALRRAIVEDA